MTTVRLSEVWNLGKLKWSHSFFSIGKCQHGCRINCLLQEFRKNSSFQKTKFRSKKSAWHGLSHYLKNTPKNGDYIWHLPGSRKCTCRVNHYFRRTRGSQIVSGNQDTSMISPHSNNIVYIKSCRQTTELIYFYET